MSLHTLLNPFTRIAGYPALLYGCVFMVLTAAIAAPCGVNFVGSLGIKVARPMPFELIFALIVFGWLNAATCFYIAGVLFSQSKIRAVDVYGTFALAKAPLLIAAPLGLLPGLRNIDPQLFLRPDQIPIEIIVSLIIVTIVSLCVIIWVVVWSYNAFAVSANVKNKWLFTGIFIVSEIIAIILSGSLAVWIMQRPMANPAAVVIAPDVVDSVKALAPEDAERIEIAKKFVERIFANTNDDPLEQFQATDAMREFITAARFRSYARGITGISGNLGDCAKIEVVQHSQHLRSVYLFFPGERSPVKMWVTFDGTRIGGFHFNTWAEDHEEREATDTQREIGVFFVIAFMIFVLPVLLILMIVFAEKWRTRRIEARNQDSDVDFFSELFDRTQTFDTVYRESQNPLWMHLISLTILPVLFLPVLFMPLDGASLFVLVILGASGAFFVLLMFLVVGIHIEVNEESIVVKGGGMHYKIQSFPFDSITAVEVVSFDPFWNFGGWGYKQGWVKDWGNVQGYFMSGTRGVLIQAKDGHKYLLGSDTPDRLAAVIRLRIEERQSTG